MKYAVDMKNAVVVKPYEIFGDGDQSRDILFVDDFIDLVEMEIERFQYFSEGGFVIYNVGGGPKNEVSIRQVIDILKNNHKLDLKPEKSEARKGEPRHYVTNLDKIKQKGWPLNSLKNAEEIIAELVKRYKEGKTNGQ